MVNINYIIKVNKKHGGILVNKSNLDFDINQANKEKNIFRSNAYILRGIIQGHPFLDGNKSTASEIVLKRFAKFNIKCKESLFTRGIIKLAKETNTPIKTIEQRLRKWCMKK